MKQYYYNGEMHTLSEWLKIIQSNELDYELKDFVEEFDFEGKISNANLYSLYTIWKGEGCLAKVSFEKQIAKAFKKYRPDVAQYRTNKERGWCKA